jgi:hypothetical protein
MFGDEEFGALGKPEELSRAPAKQTMSFVLQLPASPEATQELVGYHKTNGD